MCVRVHACALHVAPFSCMCIIAKQNYIFSFSKKPAVTIFRPLYLSPCEVTILLRRSSKTTQMHFMGHKGRSAQQASEVCEGTKRTSKLRSAVCRGDVNLGTGGNEKQYWLLTLCFCGILTQQYAVRTYTVLTITCAVRTYTVLTITCAVGTYTVLTITCAVRTYTVLTIPCAGI
jgi:hypothetical protein